MPLYTLSLFTRGRLDTRDYLKANRPVWSARVDIHDKATGAVSKSDVRMAPVRGDALLMGLECSVRLPGDGEYMLVTRVTAGERVLLAEEDVVVAKAGRLEYLVPHQRELGENGAG